MENLYAFYDSVTGRIVQRTTVQSEVDDRKLTPDEEHLRGGRPAYQIADELAATMGLLAVKSDMQFSLQTTYIDVDSKLHVPMGEQPSNNHSWDWDTKQWVLAEGALEAIWQQIAEERDRRTLDGGVLVDTTWFHTDTISRGKYVNIFLTTGSPIEWKAMGGALASMTGVLALQILQAIRQQDTDIFNAAQAHRVAMQASTDPAHYDWYSSGWPLTYLQSVA